MKGNEGSSGGNSKKFLYTGAKRDDSNNQFIFSPRKPNDSPRASTGLNLDLDDVWSIKKNVSLGNSQGLGGENLNMRANNTYYSRYGGIKGPNQKSNNADKTPAFTSASRQDKSWNYSNKGFSYSSSTSTNGMTSSSSPSSSAMNNSRPMGDKNKSSSNTSFGSFGKDPSLW